MNDITKVIEGKGLIHKMSSKYGVDPDKMMATLKATAFKLPDKKNSQGGYNKVEVTNEQMMALLVVADQYNLNPWTKEIYAFPDKGGIVPIVGVDGWSRIINENPNFDGMKFTQSEVMVEIDGSKPAPEWMECTIYRKDREHPVSVREYLDEVYRPAFKGTKNNKQFTINGPWQSHTKRMLRHKVMIQCSRIAFAYTGVFDQDEAERIIEGVTIEGDVTDTYQSPRIEQSVKDEFYTQVIEALENQDDPAIVEIYDGWSSDEILVLHGLFNPTQRKAIATARKGENNE